MPPVAHRPKHHRKSPRPIKGLPRLQPLNIWAVLLRDGSAGAITAAKGSVPQKINGIPVLFATKLGDSAHEATTYQRFVRWSNRHAAFLLDAPGGRRAIFNDALGHGGALTRVKDEATGDPIPGIVFTTVVTAGTASLLGIPEAIVAGGGGAAADAGAAGAAGGAAGATEGAAAGGAGGVGAGTAAAGVGAATVAGIFTNVSWWKGAGMVVIGVVLGVLAIREFSP